MVYDVEKLIVLGQGTQKIVYQHPQDDMKVIKIMRTEKADSQGGMIGQKGFRKHRHQGIYRQFRREILQYMQLCKNQYGGNRFIFPIETVYGFEQTSQGLALVCEKVVSPSGKGLTLWEIAHHEAFEQKHFDALKIFYKQCIDLHVVFGEVNSGGIMYTEQRNAMPEFVLVDGIGDKLLIPFRAMSKSINSRNILRVEQRLRNELGITY